MIRTLEPSHFLLLLIIILQVYGLMTDQLSAYHWRIAFFSLGLTSYYFVRYWLWRRQLKREMKKMDDFFAAYNRLTAPGKDEGHD